MMTKKRIKLALLGLAAIAMLLCGLSAYAATSSETAAATAVTGTLQALTDHSLTVHTEAGDRNVTVAQSVWVYRNEQTAKLADLAAGDQVEVFMNNKNQAAYIKATAAASTTPASSTNATTAPSAPSATATPTAAPTAAPTAEATAPATTAAPTPASSTPSSGKKPDKEDDQADHVELDVKGEHFNLHIGRTKDAQWDLTIQAPQAGKFHLTGDDARKWCANLLGALDLSDPNAKQILAEKLATQYRIDARKLNINLKASATKAPNSPKSPNADRDSHQGRGSDKQKHEKHDGKD
ncbi:hypothetical protein [Paenibacillus whitsoniae]|uniref:DUF5666 domain-containing protein n=1 Tax=Paenibacillus whitsoniae TaxID=2496558 RepID=A0A430J7P4_9BACL|nr:hypothetical protein [Paenibacillus whitsoniae]RTE05600.1 hypothetical protein EJQ19_24460 [Paenibacillus whitsoniae]